MMKTTLLVLAITMTSVAFANGRSASKELTTGSKSLRERKLETKKIEGNVKAAVTDVAVTQQAQNYAKEIGNGASADQIQRMVEKVPEMKIVFDEIARLNGEAAKGKLSAEQKADLENNKILLANAGRSAGSPADNAGVRKFYVNLHQTKQVFGEKGLVVKGEMVKSVLAGKTTNIALREGLAVAKGNKIAANSREMDTLVQKELPECKP